MTLLQTRSGLVSQDDDDRSRLPLGNLAVAWLLVLPLLFFAAQGNFSFEYGTSGRSLGVIGYVVIPGASLGIVVWAIVANGKRILAVSWMQKLILLLPLLAIGSLYWSQNPLRSAYNGLFLLINTLFAFYLVVRFKSERIMELVMLAGAVVAALGLIMVFGFPDLARASSARVYGAWLGIFMDRTTSASVCIFLLSPAIVLGKKNFTVKRLLYIVVMLAFIWKAQAATALIVLFAYAVTVLVLKLTIRLERKTLMVLALIVLPILIAAVVLVPPYLPVLLKALGRDPTLTGRTEIWGTLLRSVAKRPLLGYGYYAFWSGLSGESANAIVASQWVFGYAHNGYLEVVLQLGLVGLLAFFVTLLQALGNAWVCYRRDNSLGTIWYTSLIFLTIYYNISEETLIWPNSLRSILYVVGCCGLAMAAKEMRERQQLKVQTVPASFGAFANRPVV